ncbi:hypothetical protein OKJ48_30165 [Streptomyces kunmingensis]|uniref:Uncharacterized protein n=1 Tax=Streptomyces kunmingensis TaxID=68225 RepID=A0ABU6CIB6_9ACTN|nr:hypothetical protein [Streptomyces kunmingensis]MEB3964464.1 hypothetical protein [Streptomyces kunmingensis]
MDHHTDAAGLGHIVSAAASDQGPGALLRIVLVVAILGAVFMAWFLLRGYKRDD